MSSKGWPVYYSKVWGGRGGEDFDDLDELKDSELNGLTAEQFRALRVGQIRVRRGAAVDGVQIALTGLPTFGLTYELGYHGGTGGAWWCWSLVDSRTCRDANGEPARDPITEEYLVPRVDHSGKLCSHIVGIAGWYGEFNDVTIILRLHIGLSPEPSVNVLETARERLTFGNLVKNSKKAVSGMGWLLQADTEIYSPPHNAKWFEFYPGEGYDIIGFHGRSGAYLDAIGAAYRRLKD